MRHGLERSTDHIFPRKIYSGQVVPRASLVVSKIVTAAAAAAAADAKSGFFVVIVFLPPPLDACLKYISSLPPLPKKTPKLQPRLYGPRAQEKGKKVFAQKRRFSGMVYIYARIISIQGQTLPSSQQHMLPLKKTGASAGQKPKKFPGFRIYRICKARGERRATDTKKASSASICPFVQPPSPGIGIPLVSHTTFLPPPRDYRLALSFFSPRRK